MTATRAAARMKGWLVSPPGPRRHWRDHSSAWKADPTEGQSRTVIWVSGHFRQEFRPQTVTFRKRSVSRLPHVFRKYLMTTYHVLGQRWWARWLQRVSALRGDGGCDMGRLSTAGVPAGEGLCKEVHKRGLNDRDQEAECSRLSDIRRLRSPLMPGWSRVRSTQGGCRCLWYPYMLKIRKNKRGLGSTFIL